MKKAFTFLLLLLSNFCFSQNLVPNPSFEDTVSCPDALGEVNRAVGWSSVRQSPDYYNSCAPSGGVSVSVPSNWFGFQYAASGVAYTGFYAKLSTDFNYREYVETQLISHLQIGTRYYVSIKVCLSKDGDGSQYCGVNKLGVLFSTVQYSASDTAPICNCAQVYTDSIITDTLNWTMIKGSFIADSNYSFINIGNFFTDSFTDSIQLAGFQGIAYYYLDNICVSTDSAYSYNYIYTGINEVAADESIKYYPDPFKDLITVEDIENNVETLKLYDIYGQLLKIQELNNSHYYTLDLTDLPKGIYIIEFHWKDSHSSNHTIIKL